MFSKNQNLWEDTLFSVDSEDSDSSKTILFYTVFLKSNKLHYLIEKENFNPDQYYKKIKPEFNEKNRTGEIINEFRKYFEVLYDKNSYRHCRKIKNVELTQTESKITFKAGRLIVFSAIKNKEEINRKDSFLDLYKNSLQNKKSGKNKDQSMSITQLDVYADVEIDSYYFEKNKLPIFIELPLSNINFFAEGKIPKNLGINRRSLLKEPRMFFSKFIENKLKLDKKEDQELKEDKKKYEMNKIQIDNRDEDLSIKIQLNENFESMLELVNSETKNKNKFVTEKIKVINENKINPPLNLIEEIFEKINLNFNNEGISEYKYKINLSKPDSCSKIEEKEYGYWFKEISSNKEKITGPKKLSEYISDHHKEIQLHFENYLKIIIPDFIKVKIGKREIMRDEEKNIFGISKEEEEIEKSLDLIINTEFSIFDIINPFQSLNKNKNINLYFQCFRNIFDEGGRYFGFGMKLKEKVRYKLLDNTEWPTLEYPKFDIPGKNDIKNIIERVEKNDENDGNNYKDFPYNSYQIMY